MTQVNNLNKSVRGRGSALNPLHFEYSASFRGDCSKFQTYLKLFPSAEKGSQTLHLKRSSNTVMNK